MPLAWMLVATSLSTVGKQPSDPVACLRRYFGLPAATKAEPAALRAALLRRYPAGTPERVIRALGAAVPASDQSCAVTGTVQAMSEGWSTEALVRQPRAKVRGAKATVQLIWAPEGLRDARVALTPRAP